METNEIKNQAGAPFIAFVGALIAAFFNPLFSLGIFLLGIIAGIDGTKHKETKSRATLGIALNLVGLIFMGLIWILILLVQEL